MILNNYLKRINLTLLLFLTATLLCLTSHASGLLGKERKLLQLGQTKSSTLTGAVARSPLKTSYLTMETGTTKVLHLQYVPDTMYLTDPTVASYILRTPGVVYLNAKHPGKTKLMLVDNKGRITFSFNITITHNISSIKNILKNTYPMAARNLRFNTVGNMLVVSGQHHDNLKKAKVSNLIFGLGPKGQLLDMTTMAAHHAHPQINLRVKVVEMNREVKRALGLNFGLLWQSGAKFLNVAAPQLAMPSTQLTNISVGGLTSGKWSLSQPNPLTGLIQLLSEENLLTQLAEPNIMLMPGEKASFKVGGQIPVVNAGGVGASGTTDYKDYGITIEATGAILEHGIIRLSLSTGISDHGQAAAGASAEIFDRSVSTTVELKSGQSLAIGGLVQSKTTQAETHIPGIDKIPFLQDLTRSESVIRNEKEIVFIVTPYLVHPTGHDRLALPTDKRGLPYGGAALAKPGYIIG